MFMLYTSYIYLYITINAYSYLPIYTNLYQFIHIYTHTYPYIPIDWSVMSFSFHRNLKLQNLSIIGNFIKGSQKCYGLRGPKKQKTHRQTEEKPKTENNPATRYVGRRAWSNKIHIRISSQNLVITILGII